MDYKSFSCHQYIKSVEEKKKQREKRKQKEKSKRINQSLLGISLCIFVVGVISITELGCNYYQGYIDRAITPVIKERKNSGLDLEEYMDQDGKFDIKNCEPIQKALKEKFEGSIYPDLQWKLAKTHHFFERNYWAYKAFGKYNTSFSWDKKKKIEAEYLEIRTAKDSYQYKSCDRLLDIFIEKYEDVVAASVWYKKALQIKNAMNLISPSQRCVDHAYN